MADSTEKPKRTRKKKNDFTCYHCGGQIETWSELCEKVVTVATTKGKKETRREFHIDCLIDYVTKMEDRELRQEENSDWENCYEYMKRDILGLGDGQSLTLHCVRRLRGLRVGKFYPDGNTIILKRGYDYYTILITMKVCRPRIIQYLNTMDFKDDSHRINGIFTILVGEINDIYTRIEAQRKANFKLEETEFDYFDYMKDYKSKSNGELNKNVAKLFGGII